MCVCDRYDHCDVCVVMIAAIYTLVMIAAIFAIAKIALMFAIAPAKVRSLRLPVSCGSLFFYFLLFAGPEAIVLIT